MMYVLASAFFGAFLLMMAFASSPRLQPNARKLRQQVLFVLGFQIGTSVLLAALMFSTRYWGFAILFAAAIFGFLSGLPLGLNALDSIKRKEKVPA